MKRLHSSRFRPGQHTKLTSTAFGAAIRSAPSPRFKHPWFTQPAWSAQARRWVATVNPGFINAATPIYRATVKEQKAVGNPWENNPLTGQPFFSASVFSHESTAVAAQTVDLPLYLNPAIGMEFRGIGFDGDPNSDVPEFLVTQGAARYPKTTGATDVFAGDEAAAPTPPANLRLARACDFWIRQPRLALTSTVELQPGPATGISNVTQTLGVRTPGANEALRLFQGTFVPFTADIDPLSNDYEEPTYDELLISTVYLLSPPNTPLGSDPDATWTPYVRHYQFWNLTWDQPFFQSVPGDPSVPLIPPLAGGAAQLVINFLTASLNDMTQQSLNILLGHSLAGSFWTATGGGKDAVVTATTADKPKTGPDRTANRAAKLAAEQAAKRATQLDPDFPYNASPFPTSFLSAA